MESLSDADAQPLARDVDREEIHGVGEGLYILTNKKARTVVDTWDPEPGSRCHGHALTYDGNIANQFWTIRRSDKSSKSHTLQNLQHRTYLELSRDSDKGALAVGNPRIRAPETRSAQEWIFVRQAPSLYTIQCVQTDTFLEIPDGSSANCTPLTCSEEASNRDHQLWDLERISRTSLEIKSSIKAWKSNLQSQFVQPHDDSAEYFVLPSQWIRNLWQNTNLGGLPVRRMFDYDDFVIKFKDTVKSWARDRFPRDEDRYSVLVGIVYGEAERGPKAYNWYMTRDMCSLLFLDAQTGREFTTGALNELKFEPTFMML